MAFGEDSFRSIGAIHFFRVRRQPLDDVAVLSGNLARKPPKNCFLVIFGRGLKDHLAMADYFSDWAVAGSNAGRPTLIISS